MRKICKSLAAIIFVLCICCCSVFADTGTLKVVFEKEDSDVYIEGAAISVYKIADIFVNGNTASYVLTENYSDFAVMEDDRDVTFDGISASASADLAKRMAEAAINPAASGVTDENGFFDAGRLETGMYLICQTGRTGVSEQYSMFEPFFISIPVFDEEQKVWVIDVTAYPKTRVSVTVTPVPTVSVVPTEAPEVSVTPVPTVSPSVPGGYSYGGYSGGGTGGGTTGTTDHIQTGDVMTVAMFGAGLAGSVIVLIALILLKRKNSKEQL